MAQVEMNIQEGRRYRTKMGRTIGPMKQEREYFLDSSRTRENVWHPRGYNISTGDSIAEEVHGKVRA